MNTDFSRHLLELYGPLMTTEALSELLHRTKGGLRHSMCRSKQKKILALKGVSERVGRRVYYPTHKVAEIICRD